MLNKNDQVDVRDIILTDLTLSYLGRIFKNDTKNAAIYMLNGIFEC